MSRHCKHGIAADACCDALCAAQETITFLRGRIKELQGQRKVLLKACVAALLKIETYDWNDATCPEAVQLRAAIADTEGREAQ